MFCKQLAVIYAKCWTPIVGKRRVRVYAWILVAGQWSLVATSQQDTSTAWLCLVSFKSTKSLSNLGHVQSLVHAGWIKDPWPVEKCSGRKVLRFFSQEKQHENHIVRYRRSVILSGGKAELYVHLLIDFRKFTEIHHESARKYLNSAEMQIFIKTILILIELPFLFFSIRSLHLEVISDHFLCRMVCLDLSCSVYDFQIAFVFSACIYSLLSCTEHLYTWVLWASLLTKLLKVCPSHIGNSCCKHPLIYPADLFALHEFSRDQFTNIFFLQAGLSHYFWCLLWLLNIVKKLVTFLMREHMYLNTFRAIVFQPTLWKPKCNFQVTWQMLFQ